MPVLSEQRAALLVLILVLILNAVSLSPELTVGRVPGNDNISHWALIQELVHAVETGQNPLDFWSPAAGLGSPVIRTYQPLAQIVVALAYFALGKSVSLLTVFLWVRFLAVVCFPAAVFGSLRLMDFPPLTAAAGAVLAPLISTANFYGLDDSSYITAGRGLFPQSVAAILLLLSIGYGFRALRSGRWCALAGVFLGLTAVTHFIYGWMGALTLCLAVVLPDAVTRVLRLRRLAGVALAALAVSAFQIVPVILDRAILNHSRWEDAWKFDSFGAAFALKNLFTGELLDYNRPAVFSLLAMAGAVLLLWRVYRTPRLDLRESFVFGGALLWLLIFFGRPTWGPLLTLLGATADLHLHRTIGGLHIFLLLLAALALSTAWYEAKRRGYAILAAIGILVLLAPMLVQRSRYLDRNESESAQRLDLVQAEQPSLDAVLANLKQTGGRAYAGSGLSWGPQFALGGIPVFAFLYTNNIAQTSTTYHLLALTSDLLPDFDETRPSHYALFNVRSVVAPAQRAASLPSFLTPRGDAGRFRIFNAPGAGYFDVVDASAYRAFTRQDFYEVNHQWLKSDGPEKKVHVVLTPSSPITSSEGSPGEVRSESQAGEAYQAVLNANRQAYALFKMTWHPKWNAYVDGAPAPTAMLSPGFIGVPIMQGAHTVRLQYEPGPLKPILAGAGWLVALAACVWERRRGGTD